MVRRFAMVLAALTLAGTVHAGAAPGSSASTGAAAPRGADILRVNSTGWAARLNQDRFSHGDADDDQEGCAAPVPFGGGYGAGHGYGRGYRQGEGYGYGPPPGYGFRQPFYGEPGGYGAYD